MPESIPPPQPTPVRRTARALPERRYVPGASPHPGHAASAPWDPCTPWEDDADWLYVLDLFDHRYLWEAHEAWETQWKQLVHASPSRAVLQGLIQLAAWRLKQHQGDLHSARSLHARALGRLRRAVEVFGPHYRGIDLAALCEAVADPESEVWPVLPRVPPATGRVVRVVGAAIVRDGKVMAARRRPELARGGLWELPGGKVEVGESDRASLSRELHEELGLEATVGAWLAEDVHDYGDVAIRLVAYVVDATEQRPTLLDHDAICWLAADQLNDVVWAPADVPLLGAVRAWLCA